MGKPKEKNRSMRKWTKEDVRTLRRLFKNTPNRQIADDLKRSVNSIQQKAAALGLSKSKTYLKSSLGRKS